MPESAPLPPPLDARRPSPPVSRRDRVESLANALGVPPARLVVGAAVAAVAVVVGAGLFVAHSHVSLRGPVEASLPRAPVGHAPPTSEASASTDPVVVAAAGAVAHPGVYKLPAASRVIDVIAAAGGASADADLDRVNLAAKVTDGERVYVPRKGEAVDPGVIGGDGSPGGDAAAAVVDLNTATQDQLEGLPGVGPATAKAILDYRTQHGRFRSVNDLLNVRGIGESKLAQLRPHVRVS